MAINKDIDIVGSVLRIERSSIHDGTGLRTVVFLKGCPLRCLWCSTPESHKTEPEKGVVRRLCNGCKKCFDVCNFGALSIQEDGKVFTDKSKCQNCFQCVTKCPQRAIKKYGKWMTVSEVIKEVTKDEIFFFHSGGGITISGGECLCQPDFVEKILLECRERGIHTTIETSFALPWSNIEKTLPYLNELYVDIKQMNSNHHKELIGCNNDLILDNIKKADDSDFELDIVIRIPLIPTVNDSDENLKAMADFCRGLKKLKGIELLPYHKLGIETYVNLNMDYSLKDIAIPSTSWMNERADFLARLNIGVLVSVVGA